MWGRERTAIYAGLTGQRYASNSAKGLDHLFQPGLGKEAHIAAALKLPSPFDPRPWPGPEPDVEFVVQAVATWQQVLAVGREATPCPPDNGASGATLGGHAEAFSMPERSKGGGGQETSLSGHDGCAVTMARQDVSQSFGSGFRDCGRLGALRGFSPYHPRREVGFGPMAWTSGRG